MANRPVLTKQRIIKSYRKAFYNKPNCPFHHNDRWRAYAKAVEQEQHIHVLYVTPTPSGLRHLTYQDYKNK